MQNVLLFKLFNILKHFTMERASEKAYISKKDLEIYQREKAKLLK